MYTTEMRAGLQSRRIYFRRRDKVGSQILPLRRRSFVIDSADYEKIKPYKWSHHDHRGYVRGRVNGQIVYLHRFLMNATKGLDVDHINGDNLDNRRNNLRLTTRQQNLQNGRSKHEGYKGTRKAPNNKWHAYITHNYKFISLGTFETEKEAALAYDCAALRLFGKYANTNFKLRSQPFNGKGENTCLKESPQRQ